MWVCGIIFLVPLFLVAATVAGASALLAYLGGQHLTKRHPSKPSVVGLLMATLIWLGVFALTCSGLVHLLPSSPEQPRERPSTQDIVGLWILDASSLQRMQEEGGYTISSHTLVFRDDGTFEMNNMPDWWAFENFGRSRGTLISGSGTWRVVQDVSGSWEISVRFTSLSGQRADLGTHFFLWGEEPPYRIYDYIGDPDSMDLMVFEKQ